MISSGVLYYAGPRTHGVLQELPEFTSLGISTLASSNDAAYVLAEPAALGASSGPKERLAFRVGDVGLVEDVSEAVYDGVEDGARVRSLVFGEKQIVLLTYAGETLSCGDHGTSATECFRPIAALARKGVVQIASGPRVRAAVTKSGDLYVWGEAFSGELGLGRLERIANVPRFVNRLRKGHQVKSVACGDGHVVVSTVGQRVLSWGDNSCGQLGISATSRKREHEPVLLELLQSERIASVVAGAYHTGAVSAERAVYSWGLNIHGQLGLGDAVLDKCVPQPHLVHALHREGPVIDVTMHNATSLFRLEDGRVYICGKFAGGVVQRTPSLLHLPEGGCPRVSSMVLSSAGAVLFARTTVVRVEPCIAPLQGRTRVRLAATGLPEPEEEDDPLAATQTSQASNKSKSRVSGLKVRLKSTVPVCDLLCDGVYVDGAVEFETPDCTLTPLAPVVEANGRVDCAVLLSVDAGMTWTEANANGGVLSICAWPDRGPSACEPSAMPCHGGSDLLLRMETHDVWPRGDLVVAFRGVPLSELPTTDEEGSDAESAVEDAADDAETRTELNATNVNPRPDGPMAQDLDLIQNKPDDAAASLPIAGPLSIEVSGRYDPQGIRCTAPPVDPAHLDCYAFFVEVALDGRTFFRDRVRVDIHDLRLEACAPACGPLRTGQKAVVLESRGLPRNPTIARARLRFAHPLLEERVVPARYNVAQHHVEVDIPDQLELLELLKDENAKEQAAREPVEGEEAPPEFDALAAASGLAVEIAVSLDGQQFTEDSAVFVYFGEYTAAAAAQPGGEEPTPLEQPLKPGTDVEVRLAGSFVASPHAAAKFTTSEEHGAVKTFVVPASVGEDGRCTFAVPELPHRWWEGAGAAKCSLEVSVDGRAFVESEGVYEVAVEDAPPPAEEEAS